MTMVDFPQNQDKSSQIRSSNPKIKSKLSTRSSQKVKMSSIKASSKHPLSLSLSKSKLPQNILSLSLSQTLSLSLLNSLSLSLSLSRTLKLSLSLCLLFSLDVMEIDPFYSPMNGKAVIGVGRSATTAPPTTARVDMSLGKLDAYKRENDMSTSLLAGHSYLANGFFLTL